MLPVRISRTFSRSNELLIGGNVPMAHFTASVLYLLPSTHKCGGLSGEEIAESISMYVFMIRKNGSEAATKNSLESRS